MVKKKKKTLEAEALRDELEEIEAVPVVRHGSIAEFREPVLGPWTFHPEIAHTTVDLPPRGDEQRRATVSLIADANGTDSRLVITGAGVGGHTYTTRVWPDDQYHQHTFDGDTFEQTLQFVATHAIVTIDDGDEIRVGTPTDR